MKRTIMIAILLSCMIFMPFISKASFTDVTQSNENYDAILYVQDNNIVTGYADGTYKPSNKINRAEFTKIVMEATFSKAEIDACTTLGVMYMNDVPENAWYFKYICIARTEEIVSGYPDGTYRPSNNISFVEAAKIIVKAYGLANITTNNDPWYRTYVDSLANQFAIPTSITNFEQKITRGEIAEIIYRLKLGLTKPSKSFSELSTSKSTSNEPSFLVISSPANDSIQYSEPFYITGSTSSDCSKIVVTASNPTYNINDVYTLTTYKRSNTSFKYGVKHAWGNLDVGDNSYTFRATCDNGNPEQTIKITYEAGGGVEMGKPVIYLYPESEQQIFVNPKPENGVTISEPILNNGWNVTAKPDGTIINNSDNSVWKYLFWEGFSDLQTPDEGFVIIKTDVESFFDTKLTYLGLNSNEINDFKEYWLPILDEVKTDYLLISFISQEELDKHAPLEISPKPDTLIRVFFDYKPLEYPVTVKEQNLIKSLNRDKFTVIEWGGRLYR